MKLKGKWRDKNNGVWKKSRRPCLRVLSTIDRQNENLQCCSTGGFLFHFWSRRINPEAILLFIQPFADVVGNYACQNGEDKRYCRIVHEGHPLSVPVSGVVAV